MAVRVSDITTAHWSPKLGSPGEIVRDLADIDQCIGIILATRKGSDPHRPLFGCDAWLWVDKPANVAVPNIIREVVDALELWEPRMTVARVSVTFDSGGQPTVTVAWQPKNQTISRTTEVPLG